MEIEQIKKGIKLLDKKQEYERNIEKLNRTDGIDSISVKRYQSGAENYSYDVCFRDDLEFMKTVKSMVLEKYKRMLSDVEKQIENL